MKTLKHILTFGFILNVLALSAQKKAYVNADSGLTIRKLPDISSKKLGKLHYGDVVEVTENTNIKLVIIDEGKQVTGQWVKVKAASKSGYVFNGYLSNEKIAKSIEIKYTDLDIRIKNLRTYDEFKVHSFFEKDTVNVSVELGDLPEGKTLIIKNNNYKSINIFQRFENSITIMNEGPHCDLTKWKHYDSEWRPIKRITANKFKTLSYSEKDWGKFEDIAISDLKAEVLKNCGEDWGKYIQNVKTVNDYPLGIGTSRIFLKFILTDFEDKITEKVIAFEIPMGC